MIFFIIFELQPKRSEKMREKRCVKNFTKSLYCIFDKVVNFGNTSERCATINNLLNDDIFCKENLDLIFVICLLNVDYYCRCRMA